MTPYRRQKVKPLRWVELLGEQETEDVVLMRGRAEDLGAEHRARELKLEFGPTSHSLISGDEKTEAEVAPKSE